jgi:hypothetical protein
MAFHAALYKIKMKNNSIQIFFATVGSFRDSIKQEEYIAE